MTKSLLVRGAALFALGMSASLVGCQSGGSGEITAASVRNQPTPELEGIAVTPDQRQNDTMRTVNTNLRQANDDFYTFFLLDRPLNLSKYPIP